LIGFAGPRVIEQTVREKLPEGFQRSEFLQEHGAIDMIIDRREMRDKISAILTMLTESKNVTDISVIQTELETISESGNDPELAADSNVVEATQLSEQEG